METNPLLDTYLRQLRLPTFLKLYSQFAADAARNHQDAVRTNDNTTCCNNV